VPVRPRAVWGGLARRLIAAALDLAIWALVVWAIAFALRLDRSDDLFPPLFRVAFAASLYWPLLEASPLRATFGKRAMGMVVARPSGAHLGVARAFGRNLAKLSTLLLLFPFGLFLAAVTRRRQALHDLVTDAAVVRRSATVEEFVAPLPPRGARFWVGGACALFVSALFSLPIVTEMNPAVVGRELQRAVGLLPPDEPKLEGGSSGVRR
jgi:uncharacterized RDD family membrane protein YckC